jgi:ion channel-forming bestrophin family protein
MVDYNPKSWWKLIFMFHRSDTFRMLIPAMLGVAAYTALIAYLEEDVFNTHFKNSTIVHSLVGFVLSMLLVFRTNTAYERWWEGRKIWGAVVNNSRNLALKLSVIVEDGATRQRLRALITNQVMSMKWHLRKGFNGDDFEETDRYSIASFKAKKHMPNAVMQAIYQEVEDLHRNKTINGEQLIYLNSELQSFTDHIGACERIQNTPIPYSYSMFLKKVIFLYIFTMPIGFVAEFGYWATAIIPLVFYIFASIEVLAEEIEDPFGQDANDLPLNRMSNTVRDNLKEIFGGN